MEKIKIYLDTSVISYLDQTDAPERMHETQLLWDEFRQGKYDIFISDIAAREIADCTLEKQIILADYLNEIYYKTIRTSDHTLDLAEKIIDFGILRRKSIDDCQHIAAALLSECDIIISWNFKHLVNIKTINGIRQLSTREGFKDIMICSPSDFLEMEFCDD